MDKDRIWSRCLVEAVRWAAGGGSIELAEVQSFWDCYEKYSFFKRIATQISWKSILSCFFDALDALLFLSHCAQHLEFFAFGHFVE